jgi:hypothetical protein
VCKMHHPKTDTHRQYVKKKAEGRGLLNSESAQKAEIRDVADCLRTKRK